jgi:hypothetical protein
MQGKVFPIKLSETVNALTADRNEQYRTKSDVTGFARGPKECCPVLEIYARLGISL